MLVADAVEVNMYYLQKTGSKFCLKCAKIKILGFKKIHINCLKIINLGWPLVR